MTIHGEAHMDEILRELIASGEISAPVSDDVANYFLLKASTMVPANLKKKAEKAFMTARFKALARKKTDLVSRQQSETMTFGGYLNFVRSKLKTPVDIAAEACRISEQMLMAIEDAAQDIFKASVQVVVGIVDGFSIPMDVTAILLRNTLSVAKDKQGGAAVFPRADSKTQSIVGAFEAGLLAIAKANGKTPGVAADAEFLAKIKKELGKRGRADLLR